MKTKQLMDARAVKLEALEALIATAEKENRDFTEEEQTSFDLLKKEIDELDAKVDRAKEIDAEKARIAASKRSTPRKSEAEKVAERFSLVSLIRSLKNGSSLKGAEAEIVQEAQRMANEAGLQTVGTPLPAGLLRAISIGGNGGNWVEETAGAFIDALRDTSVMGTLGANFIGGLQGNLFLPRLVGAVAAWEGETDANADAGQDTEKVPMTPKRLGASALVSNLFLKQSSVSAEQLLSNDILRAIALGVDYAAINGSGAGNEPEGIINASGVDVVPIGATGGAVTHDHLLLMEQGVASANAEMGRLAFLTNPAVRRSLKKLKIDAGSGTMAWEGNQVMGYDAYVSNGVPNDLTKSTGTGLSAAIYGNFADVVIGQWGNTIDLVVDPYSKKTTAQLEIAANGYFDVALRHDESFSVIKDIDPTA
jgi:HK97 family phage major capsid protein